MEAIEKRRRFRREDSDSKNQAKRFGSYLRQQRTSRGIDVVSLSRTVGLTPDYFYKIERGYSPIPATERLIQIAAAMGISRQEILEVSNRVEPDILDVIRGKQQEVLSIIRLLRGLPPSAIRYVNERIPSILEEIQSID
jgi:transcriptional regulator with XRE-family HTH domain